jgi:hypothetical protein
MMMYRQQGLQKKYFARRNNTALGPEDRPKPLKIVDLSWKYQINNEQIKIKRQWLSPWGYFRDSRGLSWLSAPRTDALDEHPLKGRTLYHTRFCKYSSLSFYRYNIMCFVKHASSKRYC